jgi:hypothetical protein
MSSGRELDDSGMEDLTEGIGDILCADGGCWSMSVNFTHDCVLVIPSLLMSILFLGGLVGDLGFSDCTCVSGLLGCSLGVLVYTLRALSFWMSLAFLV